MSKQHDCLHAVLADTIKHWLKEESCGEDEVMRAPDVYDAKDVVAGYYQLECQMLLRQALTSLQI